jgi:hypothetical protein
MACRRHRSAIAARFVNLREIDRTAFWEFCNTICQERTKDNAFQTSPSKAGPATARTRVLRIHQVNRTKEKLD